MASMLVSMHVEYFIPSSPHSNMLERRVLAWWLFWNRERFSSYLCVSGSFEYTRKRKSVLTVGALEYIHSTSLEQMSQDQSKLRAATRLVTGDMDSRLTLEAFRTRPSQRGLTRATQPVSR